MSKLLSRRIKRFLPNVSLRKLVETVRNGARS